MVTYGSSSDSAASGGVKYSADSSGYLYASMYSTTTCTGTATSSHQLPTNQQACTYNAADAYNSERYNKYYFYSATLPTPPAGVAWTQQTVYHSTTCTGTPTYILIQQTTR